MALVVSPLLLMGQSQPLSPEIRIFCQIQRGCLPPTKKYQAVSEKSNHSRAKSLGCLLLFLVRHQAPKLLNSCLQDWYFASRYGPICLGEQLIRQGQIPHT
jgi:hypothetical protein